MNINNGKFYSIMCDEYTDLSNKQQLSFLNVHEDFFDFYQLPDIKSNTIFNAIKDILTRFNLPLSKLRGQTYDGASNMLGQKSGVAKQIKRNAA